MTSTSPIHVSIVHPDSLVRACLVGALDRTPDIDVDVAVPAAVGFDTLTGRHGRSHVLVTDYDTGLVLARGDARGDAAPPIVIVSGADREWELRNALAHRVRGYLIPGFELAHLDDSVRAVRGGGRYLCPRAAARLAESLSFEPLTEREAEVLALVVEGEPNKLIGRRLGISMGTVKSHIKSTYGKLGVTSRSLAIAAADRRGLLRKRPHSHEPATATATARFAPFLAPRDGLALGPAPVHWTAARSDVAAWSSRRPAPTLPD